MCAHNRVNVRVHFFHVYAEKCKFSTLAHVARKSSFVYRV